MSDGLTIGRSTRAAPALGVLSDDRLARMAAGGSTAAFSAIFRRHHQGVYRYCLSIVGNEHDARDALQETMASALRALQGSDREIALRPWLFRIAHNEAITVLRRKRHETPVDELVATASPDDLEGRDDLRELIDDLGLLTARQRSALVMRELSGLSYDEIGGALDVSPEGAKQAVYEARCALRDLREGRILACTEVRKKISAEDRRLLRGRQVRAHLKACSDCREFEHEISARRQKLGALAPLPAPAALGILHGLLGGGSGGGGIAIGTGASIAGATKLALAGVAAVTVGVGALEVRDAVRGDTSAAAQEQNVDRGAGGPAPASAADDPVVASDSKGTAKDEPGAKASPHDGKSDHAAGGHSDGQQDAGAQPGHSTPATGDEAVSAANDPTNGNGNGPASTPPGQGGTPPGQGGVPPGLGTPPPGQGGTPPGQAGTPPGQSTTSSPGSSGSAPGQTGQTPANGASPPTQAPTSPPGNSGDAPGHGGAPPAQSAD